MSRKEVDYSLYLVTDDTCLKNKDFMETVEEALAGNVTVVQLREKNISARDFYEKAVLLHSLTSSYKVPLIINDRVDIAQAIGAEGVHLGQNDIPISIARKIVGDNMIIGCSTSTLEEALIALEEGADYLGVGAVYPTATKKNTRPVTLDTLNNIKQGVNIPVVAIGGITRENLPELMSCGIDGIGVISEILKSDSPRKTSEELNRILKRRGSLL